MQEARLALLPAAPVTTGRPLRLLIVDDAEENRALLQAYLARTPHLLTFAEHGAQAVDQYMRHPFDLVLMDMQMPVMDGLEATGRIRQWERQHPEHPVTPIVAVTADALPEHRERSLAAGCTAHLTKPIRKVALLAAIAQFATGPVPETLPAREV
jgi:CheY-like chemotaxis protein